MALSVYLLATAFGPLFIGPLSELYGRSPVLHATNLWFLVWNLVCGFADNKATLIASRLLAGLGASAIYSLGNGVLGDVWRPEQRGRSMGLYMLVPLLGAAVGPIIGGFVVQRASWRWVFWATSAFQGVVVVVSFVVFRETHAPTILARQARKLRKDTGDSRYRAASADEKERPFLTVLLTHLTRPLRLLLFHPIIQIQTIVSGYNYGLLYLILATYSSLWTDHYQQSVSTSGLHYLALCIGEILGSQIGGFLMDKIYKRLRESVRAHADETTTDRNTTPEHHLPLLIPASTLTATGLLLAGWAAQHHLPWPVVDAGTLIFAFGNTVAGQVVTAYVMDAYPEHVASASAAAQLAKSLTAFGFPLFAPSMVRGLGYGWAYTMLGGVAVVLGWGAGVLLWRRGTAMRTRKGGLR